MGLQIYHTHAPPFVKNVHYSLHKREQTVIKQHFVLRRLQFTTFAALQLAFFKSKPICLRDSLTFTDNRRVTRQHLIYRQMCTIRYLHKVQKLSNNN